MPVADGDARAYAAARDEEDHKSCAEPTMTSTLTNQFDASDGMLGYLHQCRLALVWALERCSRGIQFSVAIETVDDVDFQPNCGPRDALQSKHSLNTPANLTDASPDLWKTLRSWIDGRATGRLTLDCVLTLMTRASASTGSAASFLRDDESRNVELAVGLLNTTATTSTSDTNKAAYTAFRALTQDERIALADQIHVRDNAPTIIDLGPRLEAQLRFAADAERLEQFIERLEGWWLQRVLSQLITTTAARKRILSEEIDDQLSTLREELRRGALPIDPEVAKLNVDQTMLDQHRTRDFVRQLEMIEVGSTRIGLAIQNFVRAFTQRSRWNRDRLLFVGELESYERRLVEEWTLHFAQTRDELGADAAAAEKVRVGQLLYKWIESEADIRIRDVDEPFVMRGSFHLLADERRVGWHPEFLARLEALLGVQVVQ